GEHMAEVRTAVGAANLCALHTQSVVFDELHRIGPDRFVEARPAAPGVELGAALEQLGATRTARVQARALLVEQLAGPGALGGSLPQHCILLVTELGAPLVVCLLHAVIHRSSWVTFHSPPLARFRLRHARMDGCRKPFVNATCASHATKLPV